MGVLLICSMVALALFFERYLFFHRISIKVDEFLQGLSNLVRRRNYAEALHECAGTAGPVARVIHAALIRHESPRSELKEIVQEAAQLEMPKLERHMALLATIAMITPLIGLLGTMAGMIDAFTTVSNLGGYATATDLSAGIYQSLITSAAGLAVAIPTYAGYCFLSARVNQVMHDMERGGIEIVQMIADNTASADEDIIHFQSKPRSSKQRE